LAPVFDALEERKAAGKSIAYGSEDAFRDGTYIGAVRSFRDVSPIALKMIAWARAAGPDRAQLGDLAAAVLEAKKDTAEAAEKYASSAPADKRILNL